MLTTFLLTVGGYLRELAEIVVVGFVVAGVINAVVNKEAVVRYLGGSPVVANLLGATVGIITPLCCCSAIPTAMALYRAGSRRGPACAFLIATPWFNWYGLTALIIFLGPRATLAVAGSAVLIAFSVGLLIDLFGSRQAPFSPHGEQREVVATVALASPSCGCGDASCSVVAASTDAPRGLVDVSDPGGKLRQGIAFAVSLLRELGLWMVLGVLLGATIEAFVPEHLFTQYLGGASLLGLLAAVVVAGDLLRRQLGFSPLGSVAPDEGAWRRQRHDLARRGGGHERLHAGPRRAGDGAPHRGVVCGQCGVASGRLRVHPQPGLVKPSPTGPLAQSWGRAKSQGAQR